MRRRWSGVTLILAQGLALGTVVPSRAQGQDLSRPVQPGERIRVTGLDAIRTTGVFLGSTRDSLWVVGSVTGEPDTLGFARDGLRRLERSLGSRSRAGRGAALGALIGAGSGVALGLLAGAGSECGEQDFWCIDIDPGTAALVGGVSLGATGAVVGLIAGALTRHEIFTDVPTSGFDRITVFPSPDGGVNVGLSFRFGRAGP